MSLEASLTSNSEYVSLLVLEIQKPRLIFNVSFSNITCSGVTSMNIKAGQNIDIIINPVDKYGNTARVDGIPAWTVSDAALATSEPAENGFSSRITSIGKVGTVTVSVSVDADMSAGVRTLSGTLEIVIEAGEASDIGMTVTPPLVLEVTPDLPAAGTPEAVNPVVNPDLQPVVPPEVPTPGNPAINPAIPPAGSVDNAGNPIFQPLDANGNPSVSSGAPVVGTTGELPIQTVGVPPAGPQVIGPDGNQVLQAGGTQAVSPGGTQAQQYDATGAPVQAFDAEGKPIYVAGQVPTAGTPPVVPGETVAGHPVYEGEQPVVYPPAAGTRDANGNVIPPVHIVVDAPNIQQDTTTVTSSAL